MVMIVANGLEEDVNIISARPLITLYEWWYLIFICLLSGYPVPTLPLSIVGRKRRDFLTSPFVQTNGN